MLETTIIGNLVSKSKTDFFRHVAKLTSQNAENLLFHTWNAYCECRGNEQIELFDFNEEADRNLWEAENGKIDFEECRFGMQIEDFDRKEVTLRYLDVTKITEMVRLDFEEIYQYVLATPWCFSDVLVAFVLHPVIKEIGILNPQVVGFDSSVVNDRKL